MSTVTDLSQLGTCLPSFAATRPTNNHARFRDLAVYTHGGMPSVRVGQVWRDCNPRANGRTFRILSVRDDNTVVVENLDQTPAGYTPTSVHVISRRRFRPGSRGYRLLPDPWDALSPLRKDDVSNVASVLAGEEIIVETDRRAASALLALLGFDATESFLASTPKQAYSTKKPPKTHPLGYREEGLAYILWAAGEYAYSTGIEDAWYAHQDQ